MNSPRLQISGWSLPELLLVLGVTVVLFVLGVSVLQRAFENVRTAGCTQVLKQIGGAIHLYASDHNGAMPGPEGTWIELPAVMGRLLGPYLGYDPATANQQFELWECPGNRYVIARNRDVRFPRKIAAYLTQSPFFGLYNYPKPGDRLAPMTRLQITTNYEATQRWLLRDLDHWAYPVANDEQIGGRYGPVHRGGRNVLYLEGHVSWVASQPGARP